MQFNIHNLIIIYTIIIYVQFNAVLIHCVLCFILFNVYNYIYHVGLHMYYSKHNKTLFIITMVILFVTERGRDGHSVCHRERGRDLSKTNETAIE